ncbi:MAG TPA: UMP kinase [Candidatus Paceibacterota bacterium]|nr:UMP kinase [Candidatus Paceibacterota bacterium]
MEHKEDIIIISLGGSLIVPEQIDVDFLKDFRELILSQVAKNKKFIIITGGGKICRKYQNAAKEISTPNNDDLDWIGIASLKLNAELIRTIFGEYANEKVVSDFSENLDFKRPIYIGSAYEPGHSTDWDAIELAKKVGAKVVINLSNTDYVYDSDPKLNPDAKKIEEISWAEYRKLIPTDWNPGLNTPFDPTAAREAETVGIEVVIMNGKPVSNLTGYLENGKFLGTLIK